MTSKHNDTITDDIVEQTKKQFKKKCEKSTVTQPERIHIEEFDQPSKKFEPTANFSKVFSETISKRTRPGINANFKENPRLTALSKNNKERKQNKDVTYSTEMNPEEFRQESLQKFEPSRIFFKVFSEIIGESNHK